MTKIKLDLHNIYNKGQAIEAEIDRVMEPHGLTPVAPIGTPPWGDIPNALSSPDLHLESSRGGIKEAMQKKFFYQRLSPVKEADN